MAVVTEGHGLPSQQTNTHRLCCSLPRALCCVPLPPSAFNLDYYTEVQDLGYLLHTMGCRPFSARYRKLSAGLCELVEDYGLVAFTPLAIQVRGWAVQAGGTGMQYRQYRRYRQAALLQLAAPPAECRPAT